MFMFVFTYTLVCKSLKHPNFCANVVLDVYVYNFYIIEYLFIYDFKMLLFQPKLNIT